MSFPSSQVARVLKSLIPTTAEELALLRFLLSCIQVMYRGGHRDPTLGNLESLSAGYAPEPGFDQKRFLELIPDDSKKYLYGLVEALDIYESINGQPIPIQSISLSDRSVIELKQIRDMCLEEGLRSIY